MGGGSLPGSLDEQPDDEVGVGGGSQNSESLAAGDENRHSSDDPASFDEQPPEDGSECGGAEPVAGQREPGDRRRVELVGDADDAQPEKAEQAQPVVGGHHVRLESTEGEPGARGDGSPVGLATVR